MHGEVMREMGLRSNMFAADAEGDEHREKKDKMNAKKYESVKKCVVERDITYENYKDCLFKKEERRSHEPNKKI